MFRGTAEYYARFRPPYPDELIAHLVERYRIGPDSRVLDLGCGTGQLTLPLARYAGTVIGMDPEPEMLEVAARTARGQGITNVAWLRGGSRDLERLGLEIGVPHLVTIGRAFHWMEEQETLRVLHALVAPGGGVTIIGDTCTLWDGDAPWQQAVKDAIRRWLGERRRAGGGQYTVQHQPWEEMFPASVFGGYELFHRSITREWTVDGILGYLYSTSFASLYVLGDRQPAFEADLRASLLALHPDNSFPEQVTLDAFMMFREG
jgi:SAM-dependent methyltransferase